MNVSQGLVIPGLLRANGTIPGECLPKRLGCRACRRMNGLSMLNEEKQDEACRASATRRFPEILTNEFITTMGCSCHDLFPGNADPLALRHSGNHRNPSEGSATPENTSNRAGFHPEEVSLGVAGTTNISVLPWLGNQPHRKPGDKTCPQHPT